MFGFMLEEWMYGLFDEWFDWMMVDLVIDDREDDDNGDDDDGGRDGGRDGCKVVYDAGLKMAE
jgi:hypothetical protein